MGSEQKRKYPADGLSRSPGVDCPDELLPILIGKQESLADFTIPDDTVSRLHVRIDQKDGGYTLTDLNSTNGTTVNNRKLEANEMVPLQVGDLVDIAGYHFQFLWEIWANHN